MCFVVVGWFPSQAGVRFDSVDLVTPEVLVGGLLGVMMVFYFVGLSVAAVGRTAGHVVEEVCVCRVTNLLQRAAVVARLTLVVVLLGCETWQVRRQFRENPEILTGNAKPDYRTCVSLVTEAALREMRLPGILAVSMPVMVGIVFRVIGSWTDRPLLGAEVG